MVGGDSKLEDFLSATAARSPTPGGGAVTAVVGALAAAIGEMVLNYSIGKKGFEAYEGELRPALEVLTGERHRLLKAITEDQVAFGGLTAAKKLPASQPDRVAKQKSALQAAIDVPQQMAASAVAVLEVCDRVLNFVNPYLLSDLAICADLAMATTRCAVYSVRINLPELTDPKERHQAEVHIGQTLAKAANIIQRVAPRIWERVQQAS